MARRYLHVSLLAEEICAKRRQRSLSFQQLGVLAGVHGSQVFRICRGDFKTLNPSVLKICNALGIQPPAEGHALPEPRTSGVAAMLSAEVLAAWDRTDAGAKKLQRILRALQD
jgi:transcriptional regulator with XRE-family HTH domain